MIVLHALLLSSVLLSAISAPNLPRALARINEARARALTNRARARASSARIMSHLPTRNSPRTKRQHFSEDLEEEDPVLLHICSLEEDEEVPRTSVVSSIPEDPVFNTFPRSRDYVFTSRSEPDSHISRSSSSADPLDRVLEELMEARDTLEKIEEERHKLEATKSATDQDDDTERGADADAHHSHIHSHQHTTIHGHGRYPIPQTQIIAPGFHASINQNQGLQSFGHSSQFVPQQGSFHANINQNQGLQNFGHGAQFLPQQGGAILPSFGVGVLPQHGTAISSSHGATISPSFGVGVLPHHASAISSSSQSSTISHHQTSTQLKKSGDDEDESGDAEAGTEPLFPLLPGLNHHHHRQSLITRFPPGTLLNHWMQRHNFGSDQELGPNIRHGVVPNFHQRVLPSSQEPAQPQTFVLSPTSDDFNMFNQNPNLGTIQEGDEQEFALQTESSDEKDDISESSRQANPTHKLKLKEPQMLHVYHPMNYQQTYSTPHFYGNHRYREVEELSSPEPSGEVEEVETVENSNDFSREANPTVHKLKQKKKLKMLPTYYPGYQPSYGNYYRKAEQQSFDQEPTREEHFPPSELREEFADSQPSSVDDELSREAYPTIHKLKQKKKLKMLPTYYPSYQPSYGSYYREAKEQSFDQKPTQEEHSSLSESREFADSKLPIADDDFSREASPTIHKLKQKKILKMLPTYYPIYQPSYGNHYREAEEQSSNQEPTQEERSSPPEAKEEFASESNSEPSNVDDDFSREASPTIHKLKQKKKLKMLPTYYPSYQPSYGHHYREAEENFDENSNLSTVQEEETDSTAPSEENEFQRESTFDPFNQKDEVMDFLARHQFRQTLPLHHTARDANYAIDDLNKKKELLMLPRTVQPTSSSPNSYPNSNYRRAEDEKRSVASPYLLRFPNNGIDYDFFKYKRSVGKHLDEILAKERKIVETLENQSKTDKDLQLVADIGNRSIADVENRIKRINKRSIPLMRLISDPEVRLNVPQTIENFGTATKNVFEDERAPMYHLKNLMGSSKNALLSAMRIPPQNMIIPSDYEIVRSRDRVGAINPSLRNRNKHDQDDPLGFSSTFRRVGEMVRESIKAGQETASHIGDAAHEARHVLNSARHSAPRLIIPYSQIPAIHDPRRRTPSKAILITPRILDLTQERAGRKSAESRANYIRLGHLMDAVGLSKPHAKSLELQKIIFEPRRPHQAKIDRNLAQLYSRFRENFDDDNTVGEAVSTLEDAKISVGAKNLRDLLLKMRNELTSVVRSAPESHKGRHLKRKMKKQQETKEMGTFIENLFDGSEEIPRNETVGDQLHLAPELLHPFMGRPSDAQLHNFLHDHGNEEVKVESRFKENSPSDHYHQDHRNHRNDSNLGYVLGAINPLMLERMYNQTVKIKHENGSDPESLFSRPMQDSTDGTVGTMALHGPIFEPFGPMLKPFMGEVQPEAVEKFLETYNEGLNQDAVNEEND